MANIVVSSTIAHSVVGKAADNARELRDRSSSPEIPSETSAVSDGSCARWIPIPVRYLMQLLAFVGFMFVYALRVNLSVAIVVMTNNNSTGANTTSNANQCPSPSPSLLATSQLFVTSQALAQHHDTFDWSETIKSQILAAFFYGYTLMQFAGSYFANKLGSHRVFGAAILATSVLTLLTPLAAHISPWALFALRFIMGLFECMSFPAMHVFWSYWAPIPERTRLVGICYCGCQFGTIIAIPLSGVLTAQLGWPSVFYIFGVAGCMWCVIWFIFSAHRPNQSRWITAKERDMIEASSDRADSTTNTTGNAKKVIPPVPWLKFARSPAVYAVSLAHFGVNWINYVFLTELPSYMGNVLKFKITENGFLSALPYLAMWILQMSTSYAADKLRTWDRWRYSCKNTVIRRACNALALFVPAVCIVCLQFAGCNHVGAVTLLVLVLAFAGISQAGYLVNHVDIASEYAGALMSITNTLASTPGFIVPAVVAWIAGPASDQTIASWNPFFYLSAVIFVVCGVVNCVATSGERLPWLDVYVRNEGPFTFDRFRQYTCIHAICCAHKKPLATASVWVGSTTVSKILGSFLDKHHSH